MKILVLDRIQIFIFIRIAIELLAWVTIVNHVNKALIFITGHQTVNAINGILEEISVVRATWMAEYIHTFQHTYEQMVAWEG